MRSIRIARFEVVVVFGGFLLVLKVFYDPS
jgi:hypothetical protein